MLEAQTMKHFCFLILFIFCLCLLNAQDKRNSSSFFIGVHYSHNNGIYNKQVNYDCIVGENLKLNIVQRGRYLIDAGFLFHHQFINNKLNLLYGLSYNQKGYIETGELKAWNENNWLTYSESVRLHYYGIYSGCSYNLVVQKKFRLDVGALLNPELAGHRAQNSLFLKRFGLSGRTFITCEKVLGRYTSVYLMPFFQTAIVQYNRANVTTKNGYRPYSIGLSLGLKH